MGRPRLHTDEERYGSELSLLAELQLAYAIETRTPV